MNKAKFNILALDGGGTRGIIECAILELVEQRTGKRIDELFDLVVGVSTGAILAVGVLFQSSAVRGKEMYHEIAPKVFGGRKKLLKTMTQDHAGIFDNDSLRRALVNEFGTGPLLDDHIPNPKIKVGILSSQYYSVGQDYRMRLFKNYDDSSIEMKRNSRYDDSFQRQFRNVGVVDAIMASSAAPFYFDAVTLNGAMFLDGGVITNNPALEALMEARLIYGREKQFTLVSLGTGSRIPTQLSNLQELFIDYDSSSGGPNSCNTPNADSPKFSFLRGLFKDENNNGIPDTPVLENLKKLVDAIGQSNHLCDTVQKYIDSSCDDGQVEYFRLSPPGMASYDLSTHDKEILDRIYRETQQYVNEHPAVFDRLIQSITSDRFN